MKQLFRTFVVAFLMIASCTTLLAQQSTSQPTSQKQRLTREQLAEVQAKHIANELAFSDAATEKFIKTYCSCQKEIWALGPRQRPHKQASSEQENEQRIKERFDRGEKILGIRQKYYKEYSRFLTQTQIEKVYEQERKLMSRLAKRGPHRQNAKPRR